MSPKVEARSAAAKTTAKATPQQHLKQEEQLSIQQLVSMKVKARSTAAMRERVTAAASTDKSSLVDMTLPETEGGSAVCSSEAAVPRGGSALPEHRRPDGWTSTPRGEDDDETGSKAFAMTGDEGAHDRNEPTGCSSSCDLRAGERLPKQRPLGEDHPECGQELHLPAQTFLQVVEAGSIVLQSSHDSSEIR